MNQNLGRQFRGWKRPWGEKAILKMCVLSLERNIGKDDEFQVSGVKKFQSRWPMTEKAPMLSDVQHTEWKELVNLYIL